MNRHGSIGVALVDAAEDGRLRRVVGRGTITPRMSDGVIALPPSLPEATVGARVRNNMIFLDDDGPSRPATVFRGEALGGWNRRARREQAALARRRRAQ